MPQPGHPPDVHELLAVNLAMAGRLHPQSKTRNLTSDHRMTSSSTTDADKPASNLLSPSVPGQKQSIISGVGLRGPSPQHVIDAVRCWRLDTTAGLKLLSRLPCMGRCSFAGSVRGISKAAQSPFQLRQALG